MMQEASDMASAAVARLGAAMSDAQYFESSMVAPDVIRAQLDSKAVKDKLEAMKRLIALISLGKDASMFFPDVVKNVVAASLDVRKLVYLYLVHYAEQQPDVALLAINTFQKDLSDPSQLIRALALRVLSSVRVVTILQVVLLAITRAARDSSPYVRKTAAYAISKVFQIDPSCKDALYDPLAVLLADKSTVVLGSALAVHREVFPDDYSLIHPVFRKVCASMIDMDEWSQASSLTTMLYYARANFEQPRWTAGQGAGNVQITMDSDLERLLKAATPLLRCENCAVVLAAVALFFYLAPPPVFERVAISPLLRLVHSREIGVRTLALKSCAAIAQRPRLAAAIGPFMREFFVFADDVAVTRRLKLDILCELARSVNRVGNTVSAAGDGTALLREFKFYLSQSNSELQAAKAARAIGSLALRHQQTQRPGRASSANTALIEDCVSTLTQAVARSASESTVAESVFVLRQLLQRAPEQYQSALQRLAKLFCLRRVSASSARAAICWLIGEFQSLLDQFALGAESLRVAIMYFADANTDSEFKLQALGLAVKVFLYQENLQNAENSIDLQAIAVSSDTAARPASASDDQKLRDKVRLMVQHLFNLAKYDVDFDVRDRARLLSRLVLDVPPGCRAASGKACFALLTRKPSPLDATSTGASRRAVINEAAEEAEDDATLRAKDDSMKPEHEPILLTSLSFATDCAAPGYRAIPAWGSSLSDPELRRSAFDDTSAVAASASAGAGISSGMDALGTMGTASARAGSRSYSQSNGSTETGSSDLFGMHRRAQQSHISEAKFYEDQGDEDSEEEDDEEEEEDAARSPQKAVATSATSQITDLMSDLFGAPAVATGQSTSARASGGGGSLDWLSGFTSGITKQNYVTSDGDGDLDTSVYWTRVLDSWASGNDLDIDVDTAFPRTGSRFGHAWTVLHLRLTNRGKQALSRLQITCENKASESDNSSRQLELRPDPSTEAMPGSDLRALEPGKQLVLTFHANVADHNAELHLLVETALTTDDTSSTGTGRCARLVIKPKIAEILKPDPSLTLAEFLTESRKLGGMFSQQERVELAVKEQLSPEQAVYAWQVDLKRRVLARTNMAMIGSGPYAASLDDDTIASHASAKRQSPAQRFCARLPGSSSRVLLTVAVETATQTPSRSSGEGASPDSPEQTPQPEPSKRPGGVVAHVCAQCEDVLVAANLLASIRAFLVA
ncbi:AP-3 complex subunit beta-1 [Porphyridium purpureum]|uniref:AP-3 complex subunit beta-1 n=1 Tax=Porphyridium purpureum TaxID=35688 RepID=A0A5J4YWS0_PORPP|nr:AP-3 complex subunit beta-1 [Porphyridium purpureum]|eukprot:POR9114..scf227_4